MSAPTARRGGPSAADDRDETACLVALASLVGIGPATLMACLSGCGASVAWHELRSGRGAQVAPIAAAAAHRRKVEPGALERLARDAVALDADAFLARHEEAGQRVLRFGEPGYPDRLLQDLAPPAVVFVEGTLSCVADPTVAIVGTRNATRLGRETAGALAVELADRGVSVVSGLALGIDGAAHEAIVARPRGGGPVGVIATGLERAYPRRHQRLHRQVAAAGLLLSESPIGSEPSRWRFPARNRIIAALSDAVVVVESRSAGGSMLTAGEALARDRPVLAVPGHPTSAAAAGTLDLIADGAVPVRDVTDVLVAIGCGGKKPVVDPAPPTRLPEISDVAARLLEDLDPNPRTLGELVLAGSVGLDAASLALVELEQAGLVTRSGAWFERSGLRGAQRAAGRG